MKYLIIGLVVASVGFGLGWNAHPDQPVSGALNLQEAKDSGGLTFSEQACVFDTKGFSPCKY